MTADPKLRAGDTPLTDAVSFIAAYDEVADKMITAVDVEFARRMERDRARLIEALARALPRLGHEAACCSVRPTHEWNKHGSMSFENCKCGIKDYRALLRELEGK